MKTQEQNNIVVSLSEGKETRSAFTTQQAETIADLKYIAQLLKEGWRAHYDTRHIQDLDPLDIDALSIQGWTIRSYTVTDYETYANDRVVITVLSEETHSEAEDCMNGYALSIIDEEKAEKFARKRRLCYIKKHFEECEACGLDPITGLRTWGVFTDRYENGKHISKINQLEACELLAGLDNDWTSEYNRACFAGSLEEAARSFLDYGELDAQAIARMIEAAEKGE